MNCPRLSYLVSLNGSNFFVLLDVISYLFCPLLECSFRDGLSHLRNLYDFGWKKLSTHLQPLSKCHEWMKSGVVALCNNLDGFDNPNRAKGFPYETIYKVYWPNNLCDVCRLERITIVSKTSLLEPSGVTEQAERATKQKQKRSKASAESSNIALPHTVSKQGPLRRLWKLKNGLMRWQQVHVSRPAWYFLILRYLTERVKGWNVSGPSMKGPEGRWWGCWIRFTLSLGFRLRTAWEPLGWIETRKYCYIIRNGITCSYTRELSLDQLRGRPLRSLSLCWLWQR